MWDAWYLLQILQLGFLQLFLPHMLQKLPQVLLLLLLPLGLWYLLGLLGCTPSFGVSNYQGSQMQRLCFKQGWLSLAVSQVGQCSSFNSGFSITRAGCLKPMLLQELLEKVPQGLGVLVYIPLLQLPRLDTHLPQESPHLMAPTFAMCSIASWLLSASTSRSCAISAASPGIYTFGLSQLWHGAITLVTTCFIWNSRRVPVREDWGTTLTWDTEKGMQSHPCTQIITSGHFYTYWAQWYDSCPLLQGHGEDERCSVESSPSFQTLGWLEEKLGYTWALHSKCM
jgi:hypothetical protein